ncbi:hypothetical protein JD79_00947 [Geodermatophilus normandii]|uniref:Uncharacterized protein n=1 Tax=Geodermatophilus normandii TaxID=1137989 RepID=A0A317QGQ2_9ACTN|nr:hypothetical protein [Geodermatophilus normandii]PWW21806.1 hypothetical protein JD79_00947 [Geodermatophilus normandii]
MTSEATALDSPAGVRARASIEVREVGRGGLGEAVRRAASRLPVRLVVRERYHWYVIDAADVPPPSPLPTKFSLFLAGPDDLPEVEGLDASFERAEEWLDAVHELWMVRDGNRVVSSCWVFVGRAPTAAARHGWLQLPPGTVNPERARSTRRT